MTKDFKEIINQVLQKFYPIPDNFDNISQLSHFKIENLTDFQQWLPFMIDIRGTILSGTFQGERIQKVQTADYHYYTWKQYIVLFHSVLHLSEHYRINEQKFLWYLHTCPLIKMLRISSIRLESSNLFMVPIMYTKTPFYQISFSNDWQTQKSPFIMIPNNPTSEYNNHFYLNSFDVNFNHSQLSEELKRLFLYRDKYDAIHFHLDNNTGDGHHTPVKLIMQCLVGPHEPWMKPYTKILKNKTKITWDEWSECEYEYGNAYSEECENDAYTTLQLQNIPKYNTKYSGKIYVYMNPQNSGYAWCFITYLIYAFAKKKDILRHQSSCFGHTYKHGIVLPNQLILKGKSGTTSGDGNPEQVAIGKHINQNGCANAYSKGRLCEAWSPEEYASKDNINILVHCPTEQLLSSSILPKDWNRFWSEG
jgi:hypothetical protein